VVRGIVAPRGIAVSSTASINVSSPGANDFIEAVASLYLLENRLEKSAVTSADPSTLQLSTTTNLPMRPTMEVEEALLELDLIGVHHGRHFSSEAVRPNSRTSENSTTIAHCLATLRGNIQRNGQYGIVNL
jgi:hypothetical protein